MNCFFLRSSRRMISSASPTWTFLPRCRGCFPFRSRSNSRQIHSFLLWISVRRSINPYPLGSGNTSLPEAMASSFSCSVSQGAMSEISLLCCQLAGDGAQWPWRNVAFIRRFCSVAVSSPMCLRLLPLTVGLCIGSPRAAILSRT